MSTESTVERELLRLMISQTGVAAAVTVALTILVAVAIGPEVRSDHLASWLGATIGISVVRAGVAWRLTRHEPPKSAVKRWRLAFVVLAGVAGVTVGLSTVLFMRPDMPEVFSVVALLVTGVTAGASSSLSSDHRAFVAYATGALGPAAVLFVVTGGTMAFGGVIVVIFWFAAVTFVRRTQRMAADLIRTRLEKEGLIAQLTEQTDAAIAARERAEDADVAKSRFLAAASHDLRQPLHAQTLFVAALKRTPQDERAKKLVAQIEESNRALGSLLDALLDVSRLDAGALVPETTGFPLDELFDAIRREMAPLAAERGLRFRVVSTPYWVRSDRMMLARVLTNLVSNAVRYTREGGVLVLARPAEDGGVRVQVVDTGPGIAREHREDVFVEFRQLHNPERDRRHGLGLGLAIVRRIAALLEHPLVLRSELGRGSVFEVVVPSTPARPVRSDPPEAHDVASLRVIVVDDENDVREATESLLSSWGCQVCSAASGEEALSRLASFTPDVAIVDYRLRHEETALDVLRQLRALRPKLAALVITGDTHPERLLEAASGGDPVLHKPVAPDQLEAALHALAPRWEGGSNPG
ncbi:MAG: hybrid sensor histidine kinase/response regulator [Polyangiales bacterium]